MMVQGVSTKVVLSIYLLHLFAQRRCEEKERFKNQNRIESMKVGVFQELTHKLCAPEPIVQRMLKNNIKLQVHKTKNRLTFADKHTKKNEVFKFHLTKFSNRRQRNFDF